MPFPADAISRLPIETALDRMMDGFALLDHDFRIVYMNPAAERLSRQRAQHALGRTHWEVWPDSAGSELELRYRAALQTGVAQHFECHYEGDGIDLWVQVHAYPSEIGLTVYFHDTSPQHRERAEAARVERAYKAALSNTPDLVYVFGLDHRFTYANEALLTMWGRSWDEAIGKNCLELGYPEWHAAMHDREIEQVVATRKPIRGVVPFSGTHGRRYYDYIFVPVIGVNGEVEAVAGTTRDVTERYEAEQVVRENEQRLRLAQQAAQLATWELDVETGVVVWAAESAWIYGRAPEEVSTLDACLQATHPADLQPLRQTLRRALDATGDFAAEFRVLWPDGSSRWIHSRGKVLGTLQGQRLRLLGLSTDVTARKEAEEILRNEKRLLVQLLEQAPAFMASMTGPDHVFEMVNPLYQELIGDRDVVGKSVHDAVPEAEAQGFIDILNRVYQTGEPYRAVNMPIDLARTPGRPLERRYLNFVYQPLREADGSISGVIALGIDVTDALKAEEALRQTEKLAAAGRLAASIAHEINNPLESVTNLLYLLHHDASLSPQAAAWVATAQAELARVSLITTRTLGFYRQSTRPALIDVREILDSAASLYERRLRAAEIHLDRRYSIPAVALVFEGEIRQAVANLLGNAIDAVPPRGRILLRARRATDGPTGRKGIRITVADTGHGIPRETLQRIFDPFFSTKGSVGTGLGLWITREIVEKQQGRIRVRSSAQPGRSGSVFTLFFPEIST